MSRTNLDPSLQHMLRSMQDEIERMKSFMRQNCYMPGDIKISGLKRISELWLLCDGAAYDKVSYPALDQFLAEAGYPYGSTSTQFNVPNFNGRAPAGTGNSGIVGDSNRVLGSTSHGAVAAGSYILDPRIYVNYYIKT